MKKLDQINSSSFYGVIDNSLGVQEAEREQEEQEVSERIAERKTQGKKGAKLQRINMAFSPANLNYIRVMAAISGCTMTDFVNGILDKDREGNAEVFNQAQDLLQKIGK